MKFKVRICYGVNALVLPYTPPVIRKSAAVVMPKHLSVFDLIGTTSLSMLDLDV